MNNIKCPVCGGEMVRNGKTAAGSQRWLCKSCRATSTHKLDNAAKQLEAFLDRLLTNKRQADMAGGGRTFRRKRARFWEAWPLAPVTGEIHHVVFADGIHLARSIVVLIACTQDHVIGWYLARSENSRSRASLMPKIAPPDVAVTDGGTGFEKARKRVWPKTRVQRCTFHAFCQVRMQTTSRPKLQAGAELYGLAKGLLGVKTILQALERIASYNERCMRWEEFLAERTRDEESGKMRWTHERLVAARNGLSRLVSKNLLFTFLDPELAEEGKVPSMNNKIEGGVSAQLRRMLRDHRGLSSMRRVKAVFWWCYMHSECPLPAAEILKTMPTDEDIEEICRQAAYGAQKSDGPTEWGGGLVWAELGHALPWRHDWD